MTKMMTQSISCCIPRLIGIVNLDDVEFIKMEDLTRNCAAPAIMDIKLGSRTFILSEANNNLRHDLFNKMIKVDQNAPDEHERARGSITKHRYLKFRDHRSTSCDLAYRIEGVRLSNGEKLDKCVINRIGDEDSVVLFLKMFLKDSPLSIVETCSTLRSKLLFIRSVAQNSPFLSNHSFIGTSLLFILDVDVIDVKLIDFAKVREVQTDKEGIESNTEWFRGFDNLLRIFVKIEKE